MKYFWLPISLFWVMHTAGQDFHVPAGFDADTVQNFRRYEPMVVEAAHWLMHHPPDTTTQRRNIVRFVVEWLEKTPTMTLVLDPELLSFYACSDCLIIYMAMYAKHAIQNPDEDVAEHNIAAIRAVLDYYRTYKKFLTKSNKGIKFYLRLEKKGKLEEYVRNHS